MLAKRFIGVAGLLTGLAGALAAQGAVPAGATGKCKDGTYTTAKTQKGACSSHGGVTQWLDAGSKDAAKSAPAPKAAAATKAPAPPPKAAPAATKAAAPAATVAKAPAGAPANASALCNDGTYSESAHRTGACSKHKGVKQWLKDVPPE